MKPSRFTHVLFVLGGLACLASVGAAAFAAHGAAFMRADGERAAALIAQGASFQLSHSLGMILVTFISEFAERWPAKTMMRSGAVLLAAAVMLFPCSLYWSAFGGSSALAPVGGFAAMAGWAAFGLGALYSLARKRTYL